MKEGRPEHWAGLFVVGAIFVSACVAGVEAISRLIHPQTPTWQSWQTVHGGHTHTH